MLTAFCAVGPIHHGSRQARRWMIIFFADANPLSSTEVVNERGTGPSDLSHGETGGLNQEDWDFMGFLAD